jgi:hypothetical protein
VGGARRRVETRRLQRQREKKEGHDLSRPYGEEKKRRWRASFVARAPAPFLRVLVRTASARLEASALVEAFGAILGAV